MSELPPEPPHEPAEFHRRRTEHGGEIDRLNEDQLAELTEEERVDAGLDAYDPDEVPAATDDSVPTDVSDSPVYQDARAEIDKEEAEGELRPDQDGFPPTRYEES